MLEELGKRLASPGLDDLVRRLHRARSELFELVERGKSGKGLFSKGNDLKEQLAAARAEYAWAEAELEKARSEHAGLVALAGLLTAHIQAGLDTSSLERLIARVLGVAAQAELVPADELVPEKSEEQVPAGPRTGTFTVLEARPGKSPGTIRAYCQAEDGAKHAVYAKSAAGQTLAGAVGRQVEVKYRQGDHGLIAVSVNVA